MTKLHDLDRELECLPVKEKKTSYQSSADRCTHVMLFLLDLKACVKDQLMCSVLNFLGQLHGRKLPTCFASVMLLSFHLIICIRFIPSVDESV